MKQDNDSNDETVEQHRFENGDPATVYGMWEQQAEENVEKWGQQEIETLLLAMQEEVEELAQAYLEHTVDGGEMADD